MVFVRVILSSIALYSGFLCAQNVDIYYEPRPPFVVEENTTLSGIVGQPLMQALHQSSLKFSLKNIPSKRHLHEIENNKHAICAVGWFKNPEREVYGKFTKALYKDKPMGIIVRVDDKRFDTLLDVQSVLSHQEIVLLMKASYSYGKGIDEKIVAFKTKTREVSSDNLTMFSLIEKKRGDYAFMSYEEAHELLKNKTHPSIKFVALNDMPEGNHRYLICSKMVDDAFINAINSYVK